MYDKDDDRLSPLWDGIRHFEAGGNPYKPKWDYKLYTWGYGTPYKKGMSLSKDEAERQMREHANTKMQQVLKKYPDLGKPENFGRLLALTDLTYNAGSTWMKAGLGKAVARGDWQDAERRFLQYNKAGGKTLPGLAKRRRWGADLMRGASNPIESYGGAATTVKAGGGGEFLEAPANPFPGESPGDLKQDTVYQAEAASLASKYDALAPDNVPVSKFETTVEPSPSPTKGLQGVGTGEVQQTPTAPLEQRSSDAPTTAPSPNASIGFQEPSLTLGEEGTKLQREGRQEAEAASKPPTQPTNILGHKSIWTAEDQAKRQEFMDEIKKERETLPFWDVIYNGDVWRSNFSIDVMRQVEEQAMPGEYWDAKEDYKFDISKATALEKEMGVDLTPEEMEYLSNARNDEMAEWRLAALRSRKQGEKDWSKAGPVATTVGILLGLSLDTVTSAAAGSVIAGGAGAAIGAVGGLSAGVARAAALIRKFRNTIKGQMITGMVGATAELKAARQSGLVSDEEVYMYALLFGAGGPLAIRGARLTVKGAKGGLDLSKSAFRRMQGFIEEKAKKNYEPPARPPSGPKETAPDVSSNKEVAPEPIDVGPRVYRRQPDSENDVAIQALSRDRIDIADGLDDLLAGNRLTAEAMQAIKRQSYASPTTRTLYVPAQGDGVQVAFVSRLGAQKAFPGQEIVKTTVRKGANIVDMTADNPLGLEGVVPSILLPNTADFRKVTPARRVYEARRGAPQAREVPTGGRHLSDGREATPSEIKRALKQADDDLEQDVDGFDDETGGSYSSAGAARHDPVEYTGINNKAGKIFKKWQDKQVENDQLLPVEKHSYFTGWTVAESLLNHPVKLVRALTVQSFTGVRELSERARDGLGPADISPWQLVKTKNTEHTVKFEKAWKKELKQFVNDFKENEDFWLEQYVNLVGMNRIGLWNRVLNTTRKEPRPASLSMHQKEQLFAAYTTHVSRIRESTGKFPENTPDSVKRLAEVSQANIKDSLAFAANPGASRGRDQEYLGNEAAVQIWARTQGDKWYVPRIYHQQKILALQKYTGNPEALRDFLEIKFRKVRDQGGWAKDLSDSEIKDLAINFQSQIQKTGDFFDASLEDVMTNVTTIRAQQYLKNIGVPEAVLAKMEKTRLSLLADTDSKTGTGRLMRRIDIDMTEPEAINAPRLGGKYLVSPSRDVLQSDMAGLHSSYTQSVNGWGALSMWKVVDPDSGEIVTGNVDENGVFKGLQNAEDVDRFLQTLRDIQTKLGAPERKPDEPLSSYNPTNLIQFMINDLTGQPQGPRLSPMVNSMRNLTNAMLLQNSSVSMSPEVMMAAVPSLARFGQEYLGRIVKLSGLKSMDEFGDAIRNMSPDDKLTARRFLENLYISREYDMARVSARMDDPGLGPAVGMSDMPWLERRTQQAQTLTLRYLSLIPGLSDTNRMTIAMGKIDQVGKWAQKYKSYDELPVADREWIRQSMDPDRVTALLKQMNEVATIKNGQVTEIAEWNPAYDQALWTELMYAVERVASRRIQDSKASQGFHFIEKSPVGRVMAQLLSFSLRSAPNHFFNTFSKGMRSGKKALGMEGFDQVGAGMHGMGNIGIDLAAQAAGGIIGYLLLSELTDLAYSDREAAKRAEGRYDWENLVLAAIIRSPIMAAGPLIWDTFQSLHGGPSLSGYRSTGLSFSLKDTPVFHPLRTLAGALGSTYDMVANPDEIDGENIKAITNLFGTLAFTHGIVQAGARSAGLDGLEAKSAPKNVLKQLFEED